MHWTSRYAGLVFKSGGRDRCGVDCFGLVRLVYREQLGIELPSYGEISAFDVVRVAEEMNTAIAAGAWRLCAPKAFAVAVMRQPFAARLNRQEPTHIGVYVDENHIMHVEAETDTCIARAHDQRISGRLLGTYEYIG